MRRPSLLFLVLVLTISVSASSDCAFSQGMRSAEAGEPAKEFDLSKLDGANERQVATLQRLLRRLGYLREEDMSRQLDAVTTAALTRFLAESGSSAPSTYDALLRVLFTAVWNREGWGRGEAVGQDKIIDREKVQASQEALK